MAVVRKGRQQLGPGLGQGVAPLGNADRPELHDGESPVGGKRVSRFDLRHGFVRYHRRVAKS